MGRYDFGDEPTTYACYREAAMQVLVVQETMKTGKSVHMVEDALYVDGELYMNAEECSMFVLDYILAKSKKQMERAVRKFVIYAGCIFGLKAFIYFFDTAWAAQILIGIAIFWGLYNAHGLYKARTAVRKAEAALPEAKAHNG